MPFEKFSRSYFGSNYEKARRNYESAVEREKSKFKREYPDANVNDFLFDADINARGTWSDRLRDIETKVVNFSRLRESFSINFMQTHYIGNQEYGAPQVRFNRS